ncbi:MAG: UPF0149 family protein [Gammaproteobacteria bacterium]|nr:UPF0149 family protein [Gammaproteobacteria bacterium]
MTAITSDYISLAELLSRSGAPLQAAELHGGLCGVLCASGRRAAEAWLEDLIDDCAGDPQTVTELAENLESLGNDTWSALSGLSLEFAPLLPDDEADIEQRTAALAAWCHGFLGGLVIGGLDFDGGERALSAEIEELVRDFAEISKAGVGERAESNVNDRSLFELVEYVRVGAQLVFEELVRGSDASEQRVIH